MDDVVNAHRRVPDAPSLSSSSTPSPTAAGSPLGFPLGTALILFIVFGVSTLFSCCYHWEKIRSHTSRLTGHRSASDVGNPAPATEQIDGCSEETSKCSKQSLSLPVMMPGDDVPKYVAWPSLPGSMDRSEDGCLNK